MICETYFGEPGYQQFKLQFIKWNEKYHESPDFQIKNKTGKSAERNKTTSGVKVTQK